MKTIIVTDINDLDNAIGNTETYIYGAKIAAIKLHRRLIENKINVKAFLVSRKYDNPCILQNLDVLRIEDNDKEYPCVVVAMGTNIAWKMEEELKKYNIGKLIIIHPALMNNIYEGKKILSHKSNISEFAIVEDDADITVDSTSTLEIAPYVYIGKGTKIHVTNYSHISIDMYTKVSTRGLLYADSHSSIGLSKMIIIGESAHLEGNDSAEIKIGENTTTGRNLFMTCADSKIIIGKDNMLSVQVKFASGAHKLYGSNKKNRENIITKDHVWIGMGASLLPGTDVGKNSVIGADSVVNCNVPSNVTCGGNPVKIINKEISWGR